MILAAHQETSNVGLKAMPLYGSQDVEEAGIAEVFPPGTLAVKISDFIEANVRVNDTSKEGAE